MWTDKIFKINRHEPEISLINKNDSLDFNKDAAEISESRLKSPAERTFEDDLAKLQAFQKEKEEEGEEVTAEDLERIIGMKMEEYFKYVSGGEHISNEEIGDFNSILKESLNDLATNMDSSEATGIMSRFKETLRQPVSKYAFMSLLLFLKFAPDVQAADKLIKHETPKKNNIEVGSSDKLEKVSRDSAKTFEYPAGGGKANLEVEENFAKLDLSNSYETDKADIPPVHQDSIKAQVAAFLAQLNPQNFSELMSHDWEASGSSDERLTSNWKGDKEKGEADGNYKLTLERIKTGTGLVREAIDEYDFTNSGLSPEQIKQLQEKGENFKYSIPESTHGPEKGVTYLTDLKNPATGENFSAQEVETLKKADPAKYYELLETCRFIKINLLAKAEKIIKPGKLENLDNSLENQDKIDLLVKDFSNCQELMLVFDNSPSMKYVKEAFADKMAASDNQEASIRVAYFSDKLKIVSEKNNIKESAEHIKKIPNIGSSGEKIMNATLEALKTFSSSKKSITNAEQRWLLIDTDEAFQDVTYNKLLEAQKEADEKGVAVKFLVSYKENNIKKIELINLDQVIDNFTKNTGSYQKVKGMYEKWLNDKSGRISEKQKRQYAADLKNINDRVFPVRALDLENATKIELASYN